MLLRRRERRNATLFRHRDGCTREIRRQVLQTKHPDQVMMITASITLECIKV